VAVEARLAPGLPEIHADRVQLQQALVNLCINAMEAMSGTAPRRRNLQVSTEAVSGEVQIMVADRGPGMTAEQLRRAFDSFFTTKPDGTGLGLSITRTIAEAHNGGVAAGNRPEGGAWFRMNLPVSETERS
jgi:signal transduction histidine kinase